MKVKLGLGLMHFLYGLSTHAGSQCFSQCTMQFNDVRGGLQIYQPRKNYTISHLKQIHENLWTHNNFMQYCYLWLYASDDCTYTILILFVRGLCVQQFLLLFQLRYYCGMNHMTRY